MFTLPVTGTYTITIDPRDQNTGALTFPLNPVPRQHRHDAIGTPTAVTIGTVGENAVRTFAATAGQKLTLSVSGNTIPGVDLTVRQPNGTRSASLFVVGPDRLPRHLHAAGHGHLHDHRRPARPEHRRPDVHAQRGRRRRRAPALAAGAAGRPEHVGAGEATAAMRRRALPPPTHRPSSSSVAQVLANDRPGPPNESDQT